MSKNKSNQNTTDQGKDAYLGAPDPLTNPGLPEPFEVKPTDPRDRKPEWLS